MSLITYKPPATAGGSDLYIQSSSSLFEKSARVERRTQKRLDLAAYVFVRVARPRALARDAGRGAERPARRRVCHDDARLARDQLGAEVVGVTADAEREAARRQHAPHERAQVCDEAVVPGHQLVELTARREVLILETVRLAGPRGAERASDDLLVNGRKHVARPRKESRDLREAVRDCARARRAQS